MKKIPLILIIIISMTALFSCKDKEPAIKEEPPVPMEQETVQTETQEAATGQENAQETATETPAQMPHGSKPKSVLSVSDEIQSAWSGVVLEVTNKKTGEKELYTVKKGDVISIKDSDLKVHVSHYIPNFTMGDGIMTSLDKKPDNPAVNLLISKGDEVWEGLVFMDFPDTHAFQDDDFTIIMKNYIPSEAQGDQKK